MTKNRWTEILAEIEQKIQKYETLLNNLALSENIKLENIDVSNKNKEFLETISNYPELVYLLEADELDDNDEETSFLDGEKQGEEGKTEGGGESEEEIEIEDGQDSKPLELSEAKNLVKITPLAGKLIHLHKATLHSHIISLSNGLRKLENAKPEFTEKQKQSAQSAEFELDLALSEEEKITAKIGEVINVIENFYNNLGKINKEVGEIIQKINNIVKNLSIIGRKFSKTQIEVENKEEILSFIKEIKEEYKEYLKELTIKTEEKKTLSLAAQATRKIRSAISETLGIKGNQFPKEENDLRNLVEYKSRELAHLLKFAVRFESLVDSLLKEIDTIKSEISDDENITDTIVSEIGKGITEGILKKAKDEFLHRIKHRKEIIKKIKKVRLENILPKEEENEKTIDDEFDARALSYLRSGILSALTKPGASYLREFTRAMAHANYLYLTILHPYISLIASVTIDYMFREGVFRNIPLAWGVKSTPLGDCKTFYKEINKIVPIDKIISETELCSSDQKNQGENKFGIIAFIKKEIVPSIIEALDLTPDKLEEIISVLENYSRTEAKARGRTSRERIFQIYLKTFVSAFISNFYETITSRAFSTYLNDIVASDLRRWRTISASRISNRKNIHAISRIIAFESMIKNARKVIEFYTKLAKKGEDELKQVKPGNPVNDKAINEIIETLRKEFIEIIKEIGLSIRKVFVKEIRKKQGKDEIIIEKFGVNLSSIVGSSLMTALDAVKPSFKYRKLLGLGEVRFPEEEDTAPLAELLGYDSEETEISSEIGDPSEEDIVHQLGTATSSVVRKLFEKDAFIALEDQEKVEFLKQFLDNPEGRAIDVPVKVFKTIIEKTLGSLHDPNALQAAMADIIEWLNSAQEEIGEMPEAVTSNILSVTNELKEMLSSGVNASQAIKFYFGFHLAILYYIQQMIVRRIRNINEIIYDIIKFSDVLSGYQEIKDLQKKLAVIHRMNIKEILKLASFYLPDDAKEEVKNKTGIDLDNITSETIEKLAQEEETVQQLTYNTIAEIQNELTTREILGRSSRGSSPAPKAQLTSLIQSLNATAGNNTNLRNTIQKLIQEYRSKLKEEGEEIKKYIEKVKKKGEKIEKEMEQTELEIEKALKSVFAKIAAAAHHTCKIVNNLSDATAAIIIYTVLEKKLKKVAGEEEQFRTTLGHIIHGIMEVIEKELSESENLNSLKQKLKEEAQNKCEEIKQILENIQKKKKRIGEDKFYLQLLKVMQDKKWFNCKGNIIEESINEAVEHLKIANILMKKVYDIYHELGINVNFDEQVYTEMIIRALNSLVLYPFATLEGAEIEKIDINKFLNEFPALSDLKEKELFCVKSQNLADGLVQEIQYWFKVFDVAFTIPVRPLAGERPARIQVPKI
jgi:hypothetical protein